jgi:hypothetical protein
VFTSIPTCRIRFQNVPATSSGVKRVSTFAIACGTAAPGKVYESTVTTSHVMNLLKRRTRKRISAAPTIGTGRCSNKEVHERSEVRCSIDTLSRIKNNGSQQ